METNNNFYPLADNQFSIFIEWERNPESVAQNLLHALYLKRDTDIVKLQGAIRAAVDNNPMVKATCVRREGMIMFERRDDVEYEIPVEECTEEKLEEEIHKAAMPFALLGGTLFRFKILKTEKHICFLHDFHHIIYDGTSRSIFLKDLDIAYRNGLKPVAGAESAEQANSDTPLPKHLRTQFELNADNEKNGMENPTAEAEEFYKGMLEDGTLTTLGYNSRETAEDTAAVLNLDIPRSEIADLFDKKGWNENATFLFAFLKTLKCYTQEESSGVCTVFNGRHKDLNSDMVGMFVRTSPIIYKGGDDEKIDASVKAIQEQYRSARANYYPFTKLANKYSLHPEILFAYNGTINREFAFDGEQAFIWVVKDIKDAQFPLNVLVGKEADKYILEMRYNKNLYTKQYVTNLGRATSACLRSMAALGEEALCKEITFTDASDLEKLDRIGHNEVQYEDKSTTILEMFAQRVSENPDGTAVVWGETELSYRELDLRSTRLAQILITKGAVRDMHIGVLMRRNEWIPIYSLAILKSGAAYMPLDISFPKERLAYMLTDANVSIVLTEGDMAEKMIPEFKGCIIRHEEYDGSSEADPTIALPTINGSDAFVVLYTSGSTGMPKGCILEHHSLTNFCKYHAHFYPKERSARTAWVGNYAFDVHMVDLWAPLTNGGTVYIVSDEMRTDLPRLNDFIEKNHIQKTILTTQLAKQFAEQFENHSLNYLAGGGEKMPPVKLPSYSLDNIYGPTECTIYSTIKTMNESMVAPTIGKPCENHIIYIVDKYLRPQPIGAVGEILIGGEGVARGYINRPEINAEKFFTWNGERFYHSGDFARWTDDEEVEYQGRMDGQVKLRGLRIEMGEIESRILSYDSIKLCVAVVKSINGTEQLCAYYVSDKEIDTEKLTAFMEEKLTAFMIPTVFIRMEKLPMNSNGKINKKLLPDPIIERGESVPPADVNEQKVFDIVAKVLGTTEFGVTDTFQSIGLTSILSINLSVTFYKEMEANIRFGEILKAKTVRNLTKVLFGEHRQEPGKLPELDYYAVTDNMLGIYLACQKDPNALQYNVSSSVSIPAATDLARLEKALKEITDAHSYLKTRLSVLDGHVIQYRDDQAPVTVSRLRCTADDLHQSMIDFVQPFDLQEGPLYRYCILECEDGRRWLLIDFHHIIFDGGSMDIFIKELTETYSTGRCDKEKFTAFDLSLEKEFEHRTHKYSEAQNYFDGIVKGELSTLDGDITGGDAEHAKMLLAGIQCEGKEIDKFCRDHSINKSSLFMAAFAYTLYRYSSDEYVGFTNIYSGRGDGRLFRTLGMLVETLCVYGVPEKGTSALKWIKSLEDQLAATKDHSIFPFVELSRKFKLTPHINFAYQAELMTGHSLEGEPLTIESLVDLKPKFDLSIHINRTASGYEISGQYDDSKYSEAFVLQFLGHIRATMEDMMQHPDAPSTSISMVTAADKELYLKFNDNTVPIGSKHLALLFSECVAKYSKRTALIAQDKTLTYEELDRASDVVAAALIRGGVRPKDKVAFVLGRDSRLYCAQWGIIKSGAAFIPVDTAYPLERIKYVLEDSEAKFIISSPEYADKIPAEHLLMVDDLLAEEYTGKPQVDYNPEDPAYIIYTSGSTGKPKGVLILHRNIANYIFYTPKNHQVYEMVNQAHVLVSITTVAFDMFLKDNMNGLTHGLTIAFADENQANDPIALAELMVQAGVDGYSSTPSRLVSYMEAEEFTAALSKMKYIICGGEKYPSALLKKLRTVAPDAILLNSYGPTEITVSSNVRIFDDNSINVGEPIANVYEYIWDRDENLLPPYVKGELIIAGAGVAPGYVNKPEITAKRFFERDGQRIYKSGDAARFTHRGQVEILQRLDDQVKIRGLRIELGEIENTVNQFEGVRQNVVTIKNIKGQEYLCCYLVAEKAINPEEIKAYLKNYVTEYMVPDHFVQMEKLPVTVSGKVAVKELPDIDIKTPVKVASAAARNVMEKKICECFKLVLGIPEIGISDNFFENGGTSLMVTNLLVQLSHQGIKVKYSDVFQYPTPEKLSEFLGGGESLESPDEAKKSVDVEGYDYTTIHKLLAADKVSAIDHIGTLRDHELGDVLLLGATGFLGIHILHELITTGSDKIYCMVRSKPQINGMKRLCSLLMYYFEDTFSELMGRRIIVIEGDLNDDGCMEKIQNIHIDTTINCAANVKHFAAGNEIEKINLYGTERLVKFCLESGSRLIHVSTHSIAGTGDGKHALLESELYFGQTVDLQYTNSKFRAERAILEQVPNGLQAKIMRLGNLMPRYRDGEFQINFNNNNFMSRLRAYYLMGCISTSRIVSGVELAPIDDTAHAILTLGCTADKYRVFHPYNNHIIYIMDIIDIMNSMGLKIDIVEDDEFARRLETCMADPKMAPYLTGIIAYDRHNVMVNNPSSTDFTISMMNRMGCKWHITSDRYLRDLTDKLISLNYFTIY